MHFLSPIYNPTQVLTFLITTTNLTYLIIIYVSLKDLLSFIDTPQSIA